MRTPIGLALAAAACVGLTTAAARPVSYPDAWTVQTFNEATRNAGLAHYTLDPKTALGLRVEDRGYGDHAFVGVQANRLLRRWNAPASQANLYLKGGVGLARGTFGGAETEARGAGFAELAADWEDRRWFVSAAARAYAVEGETRAEQSARVGLAPYVAEFGRVHTWLMVQLDHRPDIPAETGAQALTVTPLVRLFKGPVLVEAGYSTNDEPLFNLTYRF